ncbi:hypothetical protein PLCT2_02399 [Planctomycetaceae bacterium]|nr:hypothetical protein PLCT2_02399 [Planctomycetaceae bacterium]
MARRPVWLTRNVLAVGVVSLLTDASSEMILPFLPLFVASLPGGGALFVGVIEGVADTVSALLKLVSGRWADKLGRNRPFMLGGYGLSALARPFIALAVFPWHVLAVRSVDRVGKGLRSSPRDALLALSVPPENHGAAFGFHRAMDHAGAVIGPLLALALLTWFTSDLRVIFALAAIPGLLAIAAILFGVSEAAPVASAKSGSRFLMPNRGLLSVLIPVSVFALANASDTFLLLRAGAANDLRLLPLLWVGLHVVRSLSSTPGGMLADKIGRRLTLGIGWLVYVGVMAGLALAESQVAIYALFLSYGLFTGLSESPQKALVANFAPKTAEGTSFGWYNLTLGLLALPANLLFGAIWQEVSISAAFLFSAATGALAVLALVLCSPIAGKPAEPVSNPIR